MNAKFLEAIDLLRDNNVTQFEKLIKQFPQLLEIRRRGRSLLTYALLYDRLRALQIISKYDLNFIVIFIVYFMR
ncbi:unnamed protein product [Brugia pahangi]|uniref:ANK_REP_REGION domain-containing protein n=1 Tax=Brugia pahangi TaxID=6280 RepID=A0A0N4T5R7_BRUPA|nr:unnamed protein product [Brugia pahangi]